jgi:succinyl-CoA synthetase beta subunit
MNLLEHHAKALLRECNVPVPDSWLVRVNSPLPDDVIYPVVAKSQVPVGGRGKAGGIVGVARPEELDDVVTRLLTLDIKGHVPRAVLLEAQLIPRRELYLSLRLNRDSRQVEWLVSPQGGVEIEDNADSVRTVVDSNECADELANILGVQPDTLEPIVDSIRRCFFANDLLLLEINPLIEEREDGSLVCADAKCLVDDNARFRHPELPWPSETGNPPKPLGGTIGCIANGAGMAMSTMDTIVAAGGQPANFLDIGGGTGEKEFVAALKQIMDLPGVTSIIVNIFAGISRCDDIARGIIAAREQISGLPPLFIRLEGTNRDIAVQLLEEANIAIEPDLQSCVSKAMEATS